MIIYFLTLVLGSDIRISYQLFGLDSTGVRCRYGFADCLDPIQCEFGFFYLSSQKDCVMCPMFQYYITDPTVIYCIDCLKNPYLWEFNRTCTYMYTIQNGDPKSVYIIQNHTSELYSIVPGSINVPSLELNRNYTQNYITTLCPGCKYFCSSQIDCYPNYDDVVYDYMVCQQRYIYDNGICDECPANCLECDSDTCLTCADYYIQDYDVINCIACMSGCIDCEYDDEGTMFCIQCEYPLIPSIDRSGCSSCDTNCNRCEYVDYASGTYSTGNSTYPLPTSMLRCRQCQDESQIISYNGRACDNCAILNCYRCYYYQGTFTTIDQDFNPLNFDQNQPITLSCLICDEGYKPVGNQCQALPNNDICLQYLYNGQCAKCGNGAILLNGVCQPGLVIANFFQDCLYGYAFQIPGQLTYYDSNNLPHTINPPNSYQCSQCADYMFPDILTGACLQCPANCLNCWAYNQHYNLTDLLITVPYINSQFYAQYTQKMYCSQCQPGYLNYNNTCLGCTSNCRDASGNNMCQFLPDYVYCGYCTGIAQSLRPDMQECWQCPNYCLVCEQRSNLQGFSPDNPALSRYGRICYKMAYTQTDPQINVYLDNKLGMPVYCQGVNNYACRASATFALTMSCDGSNADYSLADFYKQESSTVQITFPTHQTLSIYQQLNDNAVQKLYFNITFIGSVCKMPRNTQITLDYFSNVYSMSQVILTLQGSTTELQLGGSLTIANLTQVIFSNLNITTVKNKRSYYEIQLLNPISQQVVFNNVYLSFNHTSVSKQLFITIENPISISFINCYLYFNLGDKLSIDWSNIQNQSININQLYINNSYFDSNLFSLTTNATITITQLQIINSQFERASLFTSTSIVSFIGNQISILFTQISQSTFMDFSQCSVFQLKYLNMYLVNVSNSQILKLNYFNIQNMYCDSIILGDNSSLMISQSKTNYTQNYYLENFKSINSSCNNINCFMLISTPENPINKQLANVTIDIFEISNLDTYLISGNQRTYITSALISISQIQIVTISNVFIDNVRGIPIFYISDINSACLTGFVFDWSQSNYINGQLQAVNNLLPTSITCIQRKQTISSYNSYLIVLRYFKTTLSMTNLLIQRQLFIDAIAIYIESHDILVYNTSGLEFLTLTNIQFLNNSMVFNATQCTLLYILSNQIQHVNFININFQGNHLQSFNTLQGFASLITMTTQAQVSIFHSTFEYNRVCNSKTGLIMIKGYQITINLILIHMTNMPDRNWQTESQFANDTQILNFFLIRSRGAQMKISGEIIQISNSIFNKSYGVQAGVSLIAVSEAIIELSNITFHSINSNMQQLYVSHGSGLYIDSSSASLNLSMNQISMINCTARTYAGCIQFKASANTHLITISNSYFKLCRASYASFAITDFYNTKQTQSITFTNITVIDNDFEGMIGNYPSIQLEDLNVLAQFSSVYCQTYGSLIIKNCQFQNIKFASIIQTYKLNSLYISETYIMNNIMLTTALLYLDMSEAGYVYLVDLIIANNSVATSIYNFNNCTQYQIESFTTQQVLGICSVQSYQSNEISDILYTDSKYYDYLSKPNYNLDTVTSNPLQIQSDPVQFFVVQNDVLTNCIISKISQMSIQQQSLVYIPSQTNIIGINIQLLDNNCTKCNALFQIYETLNVQFDNILCSNNVINYYGCLFFTSKLQFTSAQSYQAIVGSLTRILAEVTYQITINNSQFINNTARSGSAIAIINLNTQIINSILSDNIASMVGGAIYFENSVEVTLSFSQTIITGNSAQAGGGLYLYNTTLNNSSTNSLQFNLNVASNGGNNLVDTVYYITLSLSQGSYCPIKPYMNYLPVSEIDQDTVPQYNISLPYIQIGSYPRSTNLLILPSGQEISQYIYYYNETQEQVSYGWIFRIVNLNREQDYIINGYVTDFCYINGRIQGPDYESNKTFTKNFTIPNLVYYNISKGGYDLDNLKVIFDPQFDENYYLELMFNCPSLKIPVYTDSITYNNNFQLFARVRTFPCQLGEVYINEQCLPCTQKSYSISMQYCSQLDEVSMISVTPIRIQLKQGYWRPDALNPNVERCFNLQSNCNGGWIPGDASCYTGHLGALCESCDLYGVHSYYSYSRIQNSKCVKCIDNEKYNLAVIFGSIVFTLGTIIFSIRGTIQQLESHILKDVLKIWRVRVHPNSDHLASIIQMAVNYFQIVSSITTFQLVFPDFFDESLQTLGNPMGFALSSIDCLLYKISFINIIYLKLIWSFTIPLGQLTFIYFVYTLLIGVKVIKYDVTVIYVSLIYMFIFVNPSMILQLTNLASFRYVSGLKYIKSDPAYLYNTNQHSIWLIGIIISLILCAVIIPLALMNLVYQQRDKLNEKHNKKSIGYFYKDYTRDNYLWEFVKIIQKELIVIILVFYDQFIPVKGLLIVVLLYLVASFQFKRVIYYSKLLNHLDRVSSVICACTLSLAVLMHATQNSLKYIEFITLIVVISLNVYFILTLLYYIFYGYIIHMEDVVELIRKEINSRYPSLYMKNQFWKDLLVSRKAAKIRAKHYWRILQLQCHETIRQAKLLQLDFDVLFHRIPLQTEINLSVSIQDETRTQMFLNKYQTA